MSSFVDITCSEERILTFPERLVALSSSILEEGIGELSIGLRPIRAKTSWSPKGSSNLISC